MLKLKEETDSLKVRLDKDALWIESYQKDNLEQGILLRELQTENDALSLQLRQREPFLPQIPDDSKMKQFLEQNLIGECKLCEEIIKRGPKKQPLSVDQIWSIVKNHD
mgnify:CR=1 FL=1